MTLPLIVRDERAGMLGGNSWGIYPAVHWRSSLLQESATQTLAWQGRKLSRLRLAKFLHGSLPPTAFFTDPKNSQ